MNTLRKILLSSVSAACFCASTFAMAADRVGVIGGANPHISAVAEDKSTRDLKIGDDIFFKDTISADAKGNAQLLFVDKSALTVGANSSVVIDEFVYNPDTSGGNMVMRSTKGTFRFIGGALSKKNAVEIKTPVGTIGIRGGIAIVNIDPTSGATKATFVYGEMMTFKNLAGDMQTVTDRGMGMNMPTGTSIPEVFQMTSEQMAGQVQALAGREGTNAGAVNVPTEGDVGKGLTLETEKDPNAGSGGVKGPDGDGQQPADGKDKGDGADKGKDKADGTKTDAASGKDANGKDAKDPNAKDPAAKGTKGDGAKAGSAANAPIKLTSDGGYIDADGKKRSAGDLAAYRRANQTNGNGSGVGDKTGSFGGPTSGIIAGKDNTTDSNNFTNFNTFDTKVGQPTVDSNIGGADTPPPPIAPPPTNSGSSTDTAVKNIRTNAFNLAIGRGATSAQATAAAAAAESYFFNALNSGTEFNAAITSATVYTNTYLNDNQANFTEGSTVTQAVNTLRSSAFEQAKSAHATDVQANAAANAAQNYFMNLINSGVSVENATSQTNAQILVYIADRQGTYTLNTTYPATNTAIESKASAIYTNIYNRALNALGASQTTQAQAAAVAARDYFRSLITTGTTTFEQMETAFEQTDAIYTTTCIQTSCYLSGGGGGAGGGGGGTTYVATAKPPITDTNNYNDAVNEGKAAYTIARNTSGCDHNCGMNAGNLAYNQKLVQLEQASENNLVTTNSQGGNQIYTTGQESIGYAHTISRPFLQPQISGAQALNIENTMDSTRTAMVTASNGGSGGYNYVNWDVWANIQPNNTTVAMTEMYGQIVPYVYGLPTLPSNIPSTGSATYTGPSMLSTNGVGTEFGIIHANITLNGSGSATLTQFKFNIPSQSGVELISNGAISMNNTATFNNLPVSASGYNGLVNGAFFGPAAQNIGGNLTYGTGASATNLGAGVYIGGR